MMPLAYARRAAAVMPPVERVKIQPVALQPPLAICHSLTLPALIFMDAQTAVDLFRQAMWLALMIGAPTLLAGIAIGLLISLLQALTQIQEQTIGVVLKILVMVLVLGYLMPWMTIHLMDFSTALIGDIPDRLAP